MRGEEIGLRGVSSEVAAVAMGLVWEDVRAMVGGSIFSDVASVREIARELTERDPIERSAAIHCCISYFLKIWELATISNEFDPIAELNEKARPDGILGVSLILLHLYTGAMGSRSSDDGAHISDLRDRIMNSLSGFGAKEEIFYAGVIGLTMHCGDLVRSWSEASGRSLENLASQLALELRAVPTVAR